MVTESHVLSPKGPNMPTPEEIPSKCMSFTKAIMNSSTLIPVEKAKVTDLFQIQESTMTTYHNSFISLYEGINMDAYSNLIG